MCVCVSYCVLLVAQGHSSIIVFVMSPLKAFLLCFVVMSTVGSKLLLSLKDGVNVR
jgi:hypothetical protein